ncbi:MAG: hypothetical protein M1426_00970 [Patescibacteria group bacterium]|nr:hypothetical protein [Patescibacteria group bacterium]
MAVEVPVQRGPVIRTPERRVRGVRKALAVTAAATGLAVTGLLGYEAIQPKQQAPEPTPIAGGIGMPTSTPTPEIKITPSPEVSPSPSPEASPSPVPSATPEATPVPSIESVKLVSEGLITRETPELINVYDGTVVAIERNPDGTVKQFALTVAGKKIVKVCSTKYSFDHCTYTAATFWLNVAEPTVLGNINADPGPSEIIGQGPKDISPYIKIGETIPEVQIGITRYPDIPVWDKLDILNIASLKKLNNSVGEYYPRANKIFTFNPMVIFVQP